MIIHCSVPVTGVPFINSTRAVKTLTLVKHTSEELMVEIDIKTLDAPYCDSFSLKEVWIVVSAKPNE